MTVEVRRIRLDVYADERDVEVVRQSAEEWFRSNETALWRASAVRVDEGRKADAARARRWFEEEEYFA